MHTLLELCRDKIKPYIDNVEENLTGHITDNEPYVLRQGLGNLADMDLVGGSLAWNQQARPFESTYWVNTGCTVSYSNGVATCSCNANGNFGLYANVGYRPSIKDHKYLISVNAKASRAGNVTFGFNNSQVTKEVSANTNSILSTILICPNNNNAFACVLGSGVSGTDSLVLKDFVVIDLTALFGSSEIADYIYSLEQATAGAGVAWFRKYFPNAYYAYQSGKIESVNVASRKVVGKNIVIGIEGGTWSNSTQTKASSNDRARVDSVLDVFPSTQYTISAKGLDNKTIQVITVFYNNKGSGTFISESSWNTVPYTFTTPNNCKCLTVIFKTSNNDNAPQNYIAEPQIEIGSTATTFEPYKEYSFPFDSSKQLRGIFYLDANNKLCANGDIYRADGSITRKYGIVDMSTLNWSYDSQNTRFYVTISGKNNGKTNFICHKYVALNVEVSDLPDKSITGQNSSNNMYLKDSSYTDSATFKTAMSGVYLVYELATPTTESANAYQNPQRAFIDGTEEFIDAGVTAGTRDVSIPVGNNTTYQLNETLPPIEDYVDGAVKGKVDWESNAVLGAKNLLPMTLANMKEFNTSGTWSSSFSGEAYTNNGVTFTVGTDRDGNVTSITANGTPSASQVEFYIPGHARLKNGEYILNGGISSSKRIYFYNGSQRFEDRGSGVNFSISGSEILQKVAIVITETANNDKFYPMIRLASDPDSTFTPYAMTNQQLTLEKLSKPTIYTKTLAANATSVSFSGISLKENSVVTIATSKVGLEYNSLTESSGTYTVTFDAQSSATTIYLIITEV